MPDNNFIIDDATLIQKFAEGTTELLASHNLRIENLGGQIKLTTKRSEILALITLSAKKRSALLKQGSQYFEQINEILLKNNFVDHGQSKQKDFIEYQQYQAPAGYQVFYTEAVVLWKKWWPTQRHSNQLKLNILFYTRNQWYPIQNITVHEAVFEIKTLAGQITLKRDDKVFWAHKLPQPKILEKVVESPENNSSATIIENKIGNLKQPELAQAVFNQTEINFDNTQLEIHPTSSETQLEKCSVLGVPSEHQFVKKDQTTSSSQDSLMYVKQKAIHSFEHYLEEIIKIANERVIKAEERALKAERRAAILADLLRKIGIDPNNV
jgi:hypothetical protein